MLAILKLLLCSSKPGWGFIYDAR